MHCRNVGIDLEKQGLDMVTLSSRYEGLVSTRLSSLLCCPWLGNVSSEYLDRNMFLFSELVLSMQYIVKLSNY